MTKMSNEKIDLWNKNFIILFTANLLLGISFYFLIPGIPLYIQEVLNADKTTIGFITASYTIAALIIRPFAGMAVDNFGRKTIYIISFLLFSLLTGSYIFAYTVLIMIIIRFTHGITWGISSSAGMTIAVDMIPPSRRGEGIGHFGLGWIASMAIGPAIGNYLIKDRNFDRLFLAGLSIGLIGFILILIIKYPVFIPHKDNKGFQWRNLIEQSSILPSLNVILTQITYGGIMSFIPLYGKEIGVENSGLFFLVYAAGLFTGRTFSGKIFDREGPRRVVTAGFLLMIFGFLVLAYMKSQSGFLLAAAILGLGNGISLPAFQAMINNLVEPHRRGIANSTYYTFFDLGIGAGMFFTGLISELTSITFSFTIFSILCIAALIFYFVFTEKHYNENKMKQV